MGERLGGIEKLRQIISECIIKCVENQLLTGRLSKTGELLSVQAEKSRPATIPARLHQHMSSLCSYKLHTERNNMVSLANYGHRKEPALPSDIFAEKQDQHMPA